MDTITHLPLSSLRESPFNPRKHYAEADLQELADSIAALGILQPILARPLPDAQLDMEVRYEVVFGHRRFRATRLAGLDQLPVILREMTDEESAIAQAHENAKRQDITAIEEVDSYTHLHNVHKLSAEAIAKAVGKSKSYVYGRLKMAKMAPEVRAACLEDGLSAEIALEVARLPDHTLQRKMLGELRVTAYLPAGSTPEPTSWVSVREAKRRIQGAFDTHLADAPFDITDSLLAPRAGACTTCTRRAGNDPSLVDVLDADICTDKACYQVKVNAHTQQRIVILRKAGHEVIEGDKAKEILPHAWTRPRGYMGLNDGAFIELRDGERCSVSYAEALERIGKKAPKPLYVRNPHTGDLVGLLADAAADQVLAALGKAEDSADEDLASTRSTPSTAAHAQDRAAAMADWSPAERAFADRDVWMNVRRAVLERLATLPRTVDELRLMVLHEYDAAGDLGLPAVVYGLESECDQALARARELGTEDDFEEPAWYRARIATMSADEAARLMAGIAVDEALGYGGAALNPSGQAVAAERAALARRYDVDPADFVEKSEQTDNAGSAGGSDAQLDMITPAGAVPVAAALPPPPKGVRYRCPETGSTWSGRGLKPRWLAIALERGKTLADFDVEQTVNAGSAGGSDAQADAFEETEA